MEQEYWSCRRDRLGARTGEATTTPSLLISTLVSALFPLRPNDPLSDGLTHTLPSTGRDSTLIWMFLRSLMRFSS